MERLPLFFLICFFIIVPLKLQLLRRPLQRIAWEIGPLEGLYLHNTKKRGYTSIPYWIEVRDVLRALHRAATVTGCLVRQTCLTYFV